MTDILLPEYFYFDEDDYFYPYDMERTFNKYSEIVKRYVLIKYGLEVEVSFTERSFLCLDFDLEPNEIYELEKLLEKHRSIMKYFVDGKRKKENLRLQGGASYTLPF